MLAVYSRNGVPVRLTEERWLHIIERHPEMAGQREKVLGALSDPDMVQKGDFGELLAVRRYAETPLGDKRLIIAYREVDAEDGFVVTAYLARRPSARREIVWRRP
jgi:hypothetical protein